MLNIIQNERKPFSITITSKKTGLPLNLTGNSDITVCFKAGVSLTTLTKTGVRITVDNAVLGQISGALTQAETDAMSAVNSGDIEIAVDYGSGDVQKSQKFNAFSVTAKLCA